MAYLKYLVLLYLLPYVHDDHQDDGQDEAGHGATVGDPVGAALDPWGRVVVQDALLFPVVANLIITIH